MTPAEEARFIELWQQGASYRELAEAFGCALGTVASRAATLVRQGKIQPRPRGGSYPKQQALARQPRALSETTDTPRCITRCIRYPTTRRRRQTSQASSTPWWSALPPSKRP